MRILFAASEAVPFAKTGGLADVAGALPKALSRLGNEVCLIMPLYKKIDKVQYGLTAGPQADIKLGNDSHTATLWEGATPGSTVRNLFIDIPELFDRDELYQIKGEEYPDNFERFSIFCLAMQELVPMLGFKPEIVHLQDWHTALFASLQKSSRRSPAFAGVPTILTIHNLAYQGIYPREKFSLLGLHPDEFASLGFEFWEQVNLLKSGITCADVLTTVSPRYAEEIQTMEYGCGLESSLRARASHLFGLINGIDTTEWNPATDTTLVHNYSREDLRPKMLSKSFLQDEMGMSVDNHRPLLGVVGRLADQKGFDLIAHVMKDLLNESFQLVILGTGDPKYHHMLEDLKSFFPNKMGLKLGFDDRLARMIYAGADMFLMPSRFEPCGLGQMISMAYATIPVVRATGGLADTVIDADANPGEGYGFVFHDYDAGELLKAIQRARTAYEDSSRWNTLMQRAISLDFGWDNSASHYLTIFERALVNK